MKIPSIIFLLCLTLSSLPCSAWSGWERQTSGTTRNLYSVNANHSNINIAWACGEGGIILYTSNGGTTWGEQTSGTTGNLYGIVFLEVSGGPLLAVGDSGTMLRTTNSGTTWLPVSVPTQHAIRSASDFGFLAVGDSGLILRSTDVGLSWFVVTSGTTERLNAVTGTNPLIGGENGTILRASNPAAPWIPVNSGRTEHFYGVPMFAFPYMLVGDQGLIFRSSNAGTSWDTLRSNTSARLNGIQNSIGNGTRWYCVGDSGTIIKSTDAGATWGRQESITNHNLRGVFFYLNDLDGYVVGDSGTILRTRDGGGPITSVDEPRTSLPQAATLFQNFPNPFNPSTEVHYSLPSAGAVTLAVFDLGGREVLTLVDGLQAAGSHVVTVDPRALASGVYFCRLSAPGFSMVRKMILLR